MMISKYSFHKLKALDILESYIYANTNYDSCLLIVNYKIDLVIPLYAFSRTGLPSRSMSSLQFETTGVLACFELSRRYFFRSSLA